ncbi:hypothetical protein IPO96_05065 [Candidatus Saccharibacteria bacterium]|nr:MAG: hypothetical protein IPO96_05065 [Candidatus Saccharibacteria bacterium]
MPITELDSADEELRRKYPFINPGNNLAVDKVLLPNDHSRYFNHSEYARLMTVLRNRISAEDVVLGNDVLLMADDSELKAYYGRRLKPLGGISGQDNEIINKVLINCNSVDGTHNCVIFGTRNEESIGNYTESAMINPRIDNDSLRLHYYRSPTVYFSLGNSKLLLTTISADDGYNRTRRVKSVVVDLDNYKKRNLPWRYRAEVDLPDVLARFKEAKAKTEAAGVDFKKACEVSLATVLPNLVPEIAAKIPELMDAQGATQPLRKRGWFQRH